MDETRFEINTTSRLARVEEQLVSIDKALGLAHCQMEKRLDGMNEFRQALKDQASEFITKNEYKRTVEDIRELRESRAELKGKASQLSVYIAWLLAIAGIFITFLK